MQSVAEHLGVLGQTPFAPFAHRLVVEAFDRRPGLPPLRSPPRYASSTRLKLHSIDRHDRLYEVNWMASLRRRRLKSRGAALRIGANQESQ